MKDVALGCVPEKFFFIFDRFYIKVQDKIFKEKEELYRMAGDAVLVTIRSLISAPPSNYINMRFKT